MKLNQELRCPVKGIFKENYRSKKFFSKVTFKICRHCLEYFYIALLFRKIEFYFYDRYFKLYIKY